MNIIKQMKRAKQHPVRTEKFVLNLSSPMKLPGSFSLNIFQTLHMAENE
jgi:hypothetical protein